MSIDGSGAPALSRRELLRYGAFGLASVVAGGSTLVALADRASADTVAVRLYVNAGLRTMIDGREVFVVGYGSVPDRAELPGGRIEVEQGDRVAITLTNNDSQPHNFVVAGVVDSGPIAPRATRTFSFAAPAPGTYLYSDRLRAGVNQALGLSGALIVLPRGDHSRPIPLPAGISVPGGAAISQEYTWLMTEIDPVLAARARRGQPLDLRTFEPAYFLINGLSGVLAVEDPNTILDGKVGSRTLLRMINAGRAYRSIHMHGNHYWVLTAPDRPWLVGTFKDTLRIPPGSRSDVLVPFEAPPDAVPRVTRGQKYVIHDHIEMAETAHGGLYAGGMVSELVFK